MIWIVLLAVIAFAAAMVAVGIRGRRIDDHPICRACEFDVVGTYPANQRCPECGASLTGQYAVRIGHRRRRRVPLAVGSLLLLVGMLGGIGVGASASGAFDWNTIKPQWLLRHEMTAWRSIEARDELMRRERNDKISPASLRLLIDTALRVHGDPQAPWDVAWAAFLGHMWNDGNLTRDELAQYARQTIALSHSIEGAAPAGGFARLRTAIATQRLTEGPESIHLTLTSLGVAIADEELRERPGGGMSGPLRSYSYLSAMTSATRVPDLPPGMHPIRAKSRVVARLGSESGPTLLDFEQEDLLEIEILPRDTKTVELVTDTAIGRQLREALSVVSIRRMWRGEIPGAETPGAEVRGIMWTHLRIEFAPLQTPIDLAFDVLVRCEDRTVRIGTLSANTGGRHHLVAIPEHMIIRDIECETVDVILRPNTERAEALGWKQIWGEEIVYENVKLEPPAARQP